MDMTKLKENEGPFGHSERIPKPNTLIQDSYYGGNVNISESLDGTVKIKETDSTHGSTEFKMPEFTNEFFIKVYHAAHIDILYLFIVLYLVIYFGIAFALRKNGTEPDELLLKRIFDFSILIIIMVYVIYLYVTLPPADPNEKVISALWNWSIDWMRDPINLYGIVFFSVVFYIWVFFMHINTEAEYTPYLIKLLEHKLWSIIIFFILFFVIQYLFQVDIYAFFFGNEYVNGVLTKFTDVKLNSKGLLEDDIPVEDNKVGGNTTVSGNTVQESHDEVFNIGNNLYTYEDAQHVCTAYGARLANYEEIEDSYNHGAEWCNYGWSDGQMAFFPTQKTTWDELQKNPKDKHKCGRPGVNGGYMNNKYLRFGVNCYGKKPEPKPEDLNNMNKPLPKTADQAIIDKKVEFWKKNADALLKVNSFNNNKWSEY